MLCRRFRYLSLKRIKHSKFCNFMGTEHRTYIRDVSTLVIVLVVEGSRTVEPWRGIHPDRGCIRAQKQVAKIPCVSCREHRVVCWVGSNSARCANCTGLGKTINDCGVASELWESVTGEGLLMPESSLLPPTDNSRGTAGGDAGKGRETEESNTR